MPDYFTLASVLLKLPKEALDYAEQLHVEYYIAFMDGLEAVDAGFLKTIKENFCEHMKDGSFDVLSLGCLKHRVNDTQLHLYEDESIEPYQLAVFIQTILKKFDLPDKIGFHWANTCSKAVPDAYSGGCYYVSKDNIRWWSSYEALDQFEKEDTGGYACRLVLGSKGDGFVIESFDTKTERDAFVKGVQATDGYLEAGIDYPDETGKFTPLPEVTKESLKIAGYSETDLG